MPPLQILKTTLSFVKPNIDNGKTFDFTDQDEDDDDPERRAAWLETPMAGQVGGGLGDGIMASITDFGLGDLVGTLDKRVGVPCDLLSSLPVQSVSR